MPEFVTDVEFTPKTREYATGPRGPRARSDEQKPWDSAFKVAMDGTGYLHVQVTPDEAEDAKKRVASAARFYGMATTEGAARPGAAKGSVILSWQVRVPTKRGPRAKKTAE